MRKWLYLLTGVNEYIRAILGDTFSQVEEASYYQEKLGTTML